MMKNIVFLLIASIIVLSLNAQSPSGYTEQEAYALIDRIEGTPFQQTTAPGAQWYPQASFGLFIHWGIHAVTGSDPSWSMLKNIPWLGNYTPVPPEKYYKLSEEFNPQNYDPEKWVLAAKNAGFQYLVITAKHHDGYCLWPTEYGQYNTKNYMEGRDLLRPLIDACRKYGLRIGLYFSPRDWSYPDFPMPFKDYDYAQKADARYPEGVNQQKYDEFFKYTVGQMSEILTRYGQIDVIWFDGIGWPNVNTHDDKLHAWLREVQPDMVINPRWETLNKNIRFGDFHTEEIAWRKRMAEGRPYPAGEWWEFNETWSGHWGYSPTSPYRDFDKVIAALVYARSYGGNYLPDIGPQPDGGMRPGFYEQCIKLSEWMAVNKESVIGTTDFADWNDISNVPLTRNGEFVYAHLLSDADGQVTLKWNAKPKQAVLLTDGQPVAFEYKNKEIRIHIDESRRGFVDDVVKIVFE